MKITDARIGQQVLYHGVPMTVTGIFTFYGDLDKPQNGTLYLDHEDNSADVWEVLVEEVEPITPTPTEQDYTDQMSRLNEEWKENLELQRKMLTVKAANIFGEWLQQGSITPDALKCYIRQFIKRMEDEQYED